MLREKIEQAAEELYSNRIAGLASGHSHTVAVLVPSDRCRPFMQSLVMVLNKMNLQPLLGCHEYNPTKEAGI